MKIEECDYLIEECQKEIDSWMTHLEALKKLREKIIERGMETRKGI